MREGRFSMLSTDIEGKLVERIQAEVTERMLETRHLRRLPTDLPGDHLVCLVGELSLSIPSHALQSYEFTLLPKVRQALGNPSDLLVGSYEWAISETEKIALEESKPFSLAAAYSNDSSAIAMSVFAMRLDAGFFLTGLRTLWTQEYPLLFRRLWNVCELGRWDELLKSSSSHLRSYSAYLRQLLADSPAVIDHDYFGTLLNIARDENSLKLAEATGQFANKANKASEPCIIHPWQVLLTYDFLLQIFPNEMETGEISLIEDDASGVPIIYNRNENSRYGVLFLNIIGETLEIEIPDDFANLLSSKINGFFVFDTVDDLEIIRETDEFDDKPLVSTRFIGVLKAQSINPLKKPQLGLSSFKINTEDIEMDLKWLT